MYSIYISNMVTDKLVMLSRREYDRRYCVWRHGFLNINSKVKPASPCGKNPLFTKCALRLLSQGTVMSRMVRLPNPMDDV